jgi:hypothetical protein
MKRVVLGGMMSVLVACGSAPEPKAPEPEAPPPVQQEAKPAAQVSQELGSIDEGATKKTFDKLTDSLLTCQKDGISRVDYLAGDAKFFLRIGQDGRVKWAYLEDSTLGDRDTEKCMLRVVGGAQWPQPEGGEAQVERSISFDPTDARAPASWSSDKVQSVLSSKQGSDAIKCKVGTRGMYKVTAYVEPVSKKHGKVVAVGVAPPSKEGEAKADCIAEAVKDWKVPSPGSYAAKVTFTL